MGLIELDQMSSVLQMRTLWMSGYLTFLQGDNIESRVQTPSYQVEHKLMNTNEHKSQNEYSGILYRCKSGQKIIMKSI